MTIGGLAMAVAVAMMCMGFVLAAQSGNVQSKALRPLTYFFIWFGSAAFMIGLVLWLVGV